MQETIKERLMKLANAQNRLTEISGRLDRMEKSVMTMEKCSFELLNKSDKLLSMSNTVLLLVERLKELFASVNPDTIIDKDMLAAIIDDICSNVQSIYNTCVEANSSSHEIEEEAAYQRENNDFINETLAIVSSCINSAVACAELCLLNGNM